MADFSINTIRKGKILLVGEPLCLFTAKQEGPLSRVDTFQASVAGAELNVAIGLQRLGADPVYVSKVGADPFGEKIKNTVFAGHGIDARLSTDPHLATGFMLKSKETSGADPQTYYYRRGSAASTLSVTDLLNLHWDQISILHMTGILPALSSATADLSCELIKRAHAHGVFVSFDPNLRPSLWDSRERMENTVLSLASSCDLVMPGRKEGTALFGQTELVPLAQSFLDNGSSYVVIKDGPSGACAASRDAFTYVPGFRVDHVIDTVGAGDGFAAGLLSSLSEGQSMNSALERACAVGAMQTQFVSDNAGLPDRSQLQKFISGHARTAVRKPCTPSTLFAP